MVAASRPYLIAPAVNTLDGNRGTNSCNDAGTKETRLSLSLSSSPCQPSGLDPSPCQPSGLAPSPCHPSGLAPSPCQPSGLAPSPCACVSLLLRARPLDAPLAGLGCRVVLALCRSGHPPHPHDTTTTTDSTNDNNDSNGSTAAVATTVATAAAAVAAAAANRLKQAHATARLGEGGVCEALVSVLQHHRTNPPVVILVCRTANHLVSEDQGNSVRWGAAGGAALVDAIDRYPRNIEVREMEKS